MFGGGPGKPPPLPPAPPTGPTDAEVQTAAAAERARLRARRGRASTILTSGGGPLASASDTPGSTNLIGGTGGMSA